PGRLSNREGVSGETHGGFQLAPPRRRPRDGGQRFPFLDCVAREPREREDAFSFGTRLLEVTPDEVETGFRLVDGDERRGSRNAASLLLGRRFRLVVQRERFARGKAL